MQINKLFIEGLSNKKVSTVGRVIKEMNLFEFKDNQIQNIKENYIKLEEVFYTVWFLEKNEFVKLSRGVENTHISFSLDGVAKEDYIYERFKYLQSQIDDIWGREISILPGFYQFLANDYLTNDSYLEWVKFRLALVVAIVAAVATGLFTKLFDILLT